MTTQIWVLPVS